MVMCIHTHTNLEIFIPGIPLQVLRSRRQPLEPFIIAHLTRCILYYTLYLAAQNLFIQWFYAYTTILGQEQLYLYAIMMLWEYFSMIYMRSVSSIRLFPRITLAFFLVFHVYYYSYPMGFHMLFLACIALASVVCMVQCIRVFETRAFRLGKVSIEQPR
ncbi:hypothetical protein EON65_22545 [archaeon]|nr:MAG: hypothetical protein EON65_22545 [archaeon]